MDIVIRENYLDMSKYAANIITEMIKNKPDCILGLATGSTPIGPYQELIKMYNEGLDFSNVKTLNLDEYLGIGIDLSKPYIWIRVLRDLCMRSFFVTSILSKKIFTFRMDKRRIPRNLANPTKKKSIRWKRSTFRCWE